MILLVFKSKNSNSKTVYPENETADGSIGK